VAAIEKGFVQREIEEAAYAAQREQEEGRRIVVGVNAWREEREEPPLTLSIDPRIEEEQVERLRAHRAARDSQAAVAILGRLRDAAREDRNLMPGLLEAVSAGATIGEIVAALKSVFGEYRPGG
jgi:methylmalonyl-CoA mutase N-terminal domain/subunit